MVLKDGDEIQICNCVLRFSQTSDPLRPQPTAPGLGAATNPSGPPAMSGSGFPPPSMPPQSAAALHPTGPYPAQGLPPGMPGMDDGLGGIGQNPEILALEQAPVPAKKAPLPWGAFILGLLLSVLGAGGAAAYFLVIEDGGALALADEGPGDGEKNPADNNGKGKGDATDDASGNKKGDNKEDEQGAAAATNKGDGRDGGSAAADADAPKAGDGGTAVAVKTDGEGGDGAKNTEWLIPEVLSAKGAPIRAGNVSGNVKKIAVENGATVEKGAVIFELNPAGINRALATKRIEVKSLEELVEIQGTDEAKEMLAEEQKKMRVLLAQSD
jgi:hypothetical protein